MTSQCHGHYSKKASCVCLFCMHRYCMKKKVDVSFLGNLPFFNCIFRVTRIPFEKVHNYFLKRSPLNIFLGKMTFSISEVAFLVGYGKYQVMCNFS